jgi:hypothetical protein
METDYFIQQYKHGSWVFDSLHSALLPNTPSSTEAWIKRHMGAEVPFCVTRTLTHNLWNQFPNLNIPLDPPHEVHWSLDVEPHRVKSSQRGKWAEDKSLVHWELLLSILLTISGSLAPSFLSCPLQVAALLHTSAYFCPLQGGFLQDDTESTWITT